jgi:hypothetical protein
MLFIASSVVAVVSAPELDGVTPVGAEDSTAQPVAIPETVSAARVHDILDLEFRFTMSTIRKHRAYPGAQAP